MFGEKTTTRQPGVEQRPSYFCPTAAAIPKHKRNIPANPVIHCAKCKPCVLSDGRTLGSTSAGIVSVASASACDSTMIVIRFENELSMPCSVEE